MDQKCATPCGSSGNEPRTGIALETNQQSHFDCASGGAPSSLLPTVRQVACRPANPPPPHTVCVGHDSNLRADRRATAPAALGCHVAEIQRTAVQTCQALS